MVIGLQHILPCCVVGMPLSEPNVERYLEEHPSFLQNYVVSHLTEGDIKDLYSHWFQAHGRKLSTEKERKRSRNEEERKVMDTDQVMRELSPPAPSKKSSIIDHTLVVPSKGTVDSPNKSTESRDIVGKPRISNAKHFRKTLSREGAPILKPYRRDYCLNDPMVRFAPSPLGDHPERPDSVLSSQSFSDDLINIRSLLPTNLQLPCDPTEEPSARRRSREEWRQLNEPDLMMELVRDIAQDLDLVSLCFKILLNVGILTNGDRCSLFLIFGQGDQRFLVSKLFDVTETSELADMYKHKPIRIPFGKGIVGYVASTGETVNIIDAYKDDRFNQAIDQQTGYTTKSILCMPVKNNQGEVVGVAQVINKKDEEVPFSSKDEHIFERYLVFCGIGITNALLFQSSVIMYKRSDSLVVLAHYIFEEQRDMDTLLRRVLKKGCDMFNCEGCRILLLDFNEIIPDTFLIDPDIVPTIPEHGPQAIKFSTVYETHLGDGTVDGASSSGVFDFAKKDKPADNLANYISNTLKTINTVAGESVEGFGNVDGSAIGVERNVASILAMPILTGDKKILGVVEIINKKGEDRFDRNDESLFEAFTLFCGLGIYNVVNFEKLIKANNAQKVVLEILSYHASANKDEVAIIERMECPTAKQLKICSYDFADNTLSRDETVVATLRMFVDLGLVEKFNIDYSTLIRWSITVRKNYRDVMYHNWRHAFNVAQTMFAMLTAGQMKNVFTDLECFALLVGSICHDIDHRGTNNKFQEISNSPLANLYSTSFMEYHHFNHFMTISTVEENNIFKSLDGPQYHDFVELTKGTILATDLALYFKHKGTFAQIVKEESPDWTIPRNRELLRSMMITGCDLSAITKPWEVQRMVAEKIASEFFMQGDIERQYGHAPMAMMDRSKRDELPKMQVQFIDSVCMGVYESLEKANPLFRPLLDGCLSNRRNWSNLSERRTSFADITTANISLTSISSGRIGSTIQQQAEEMTPSDDDG